MLKHFETYLRAGRILSLCQSRKGPSCHKWCFTHRRGLCTLYFLLVAQTRLQYWEQGGRVYAVNAVLEFPKRQQRPRLTRLAFFLSSLHVLVLKHFETYLRAGRILSLCQSRKGPSCHKWCFTHRRGLCTLYFLLVAQTRLQYWEQGGRVYAVNAVLEFPKRQQRPRLTRLAFFYHLCMY